MTTKKIFILTISKTFLKGHPKEGFSTNFAQQIIEDKKIHTIRANYAYWARIIEKVNSGAAILSLRQWADKPYKSKLIEFKQLEKAFIQPITIMGSNGLVWLNDKYLDEFEVEKLAKNDGLSKTDFEDWFLGNIEAGIIHFTDFRY